MATKKPLTTEELLLAIHEEIKNLHTTLGTGMLKIHEALLADRNVEVVIPHPGTNEPGKIDLKPGAVNVAKDPAPAPGEDEIPRFIQEYVEAHPGCKAGDLTREFKCSQNKALLAVKKYGKKAPPAGAVVVKDNPVVDQGSPVPEEITVEVLREKITEFSRTFGMNEALQVNEQFGGNKKVSKIPTENYAAVWNEMAARLEMKAKVEEANAEPQKGESLGGASITKEDIQRAGGVFVKKYGDPAFRELLKKYVTKGEEPKISKVDPAKYPALHEALDNA